MKHKHNMWVKHGFWSISNGVFFPFFCEASSSPKKACSLHNEAYHFIWKGITYCKYIYIYIYIEQDNISFCSSLRFILSSLNIFFFPPSDYFVPLSQWFESWADLLQNGGPLSRLFRTKLNKQVGNFRTTLSWQSFSLNMNISTKELSSKNILTNLIYLQFYIH